MVHNEIQVNLPYTFTWTIYVSAIQIVPTSATITITNKNGTSVQTGSGIIDPDGTITYTLLAANNDTIDINYKVVVSYVYNTITTEIAELFDVVKQTIVNNVTDINLFTYLPQLRRDLFDLEGITDNNGSATTLQDDKLKSDDRSFTGGKVELYISDTIVHDANITNFSKTTGTVTFSPSYNSTFGTSLKYIIRPSYKEFIDRAFQDHVRPSLRKRVGPIGGYIDSNVVNNLIIYKALEIICFGNIEISGDVWDIRYQGFREKYNNEYAAFSEGYDYNEDGYISDTEDDNKISNIMRNVKR